MQKFIINKREIKKYIPFTLRLEEGLYEKSKKIVVDNDAKSMNQFFNECIKFAIDNLKIEE